MICQMGYLTIEKCGEKGENLQPYTNNAIISKAGVVHSMVKVSCGARARPKHKSINDHVLTILLDFLLSS